ncbi:Threonine/homoserine/homoserine lactone efflux protein [Terribacillus aidingensis]|uniref:Threonine/homoserine/homoserine lactone efflux protein n=1 Tax=Terribacillus aidingensis TaxID=586416 RepID=A0A285N490_9BACI|nr:LysE family translocator [Terribacillus aidingensis]SNZ04250.1 Threonine/homoserine/homoserine lactone efflux protein [Terribacillus aidingensis]
MLAIVLLGLALAAAPGPDFLLMTRNTLSQGKRFGFLTLLGNRCSLLIHISFALLGLSYILQQSVVLFTIIRLLGACYLIYLGIKKILQLIRTQKCDNEKETRKLSEMQAFRMGFLSNFLNPKVSLFFLSIFPQFASTEQLHHPLVFLICFLLGNSSWYIGTVLLVGMKRIRRFVMRFQAYLDVLFGFSFLLYGGKIIWEDAIQKLSFLEKTVRLR